MVWLKCTLTAILSIIGVTSAYISGLDSDFMGAIGFIIGLSSWFLSNWFVDWVKENV